jgi:parallel beta-helix repeat protein
MSQRGKPRDNEPGPALGRTGARKTAKRQAAPHFALRDLPKIFAALTPAEREHARQQRWVPSPCQIRSKPNDGAPPSATNTSLSTATHDRDALLRSRCTPLCVGVTDTALFDEIEATDTPNYVIVFSRRPDRPIVYGCVQKVHLADQLCTPAMVDAPGHCVYHDGEHGERDLSRPRLRLLGCFSNGQEAYITLRAAKALLARAHSDGPQKISLRPRKYAPLELIGLTADSTAPARNELCYDLVDEPFELSPIDADRELVNVDGDKGLPLDRAQQRRALTGITKYITPNRSRKIAALRALPAQQTSKREQREQREQRKQRKQRKQKTPQSHGGRTRTPTEDTQYVVDVPELVRAVACPHANVIILRPGVFTLTADLVIDRPVSIRAEFAQETRLRLRNHAKIIWRSAVNRDDDLVEGLHGLIVERQRDFTTTLKCKKKTAAVQGTCIAPAPYDEPVVNFDQRCAVDAIPRQPYHVAWLAPPAAGADEKFQQLIQKLTQATTHCGAGTAGAVDFYLVPESQIANVQKHLQLAELDDGHAVAGSLLLLASKSDDAAADEGAAAAAGAGAAATGAGDLCLLIEHGAPHISHCTVKGAGICVHPGARIDRRPQQTVSIDNSVICDCTTGLLIGANHVGESQEPRLFVVAQLNDIHDNAQAGVIVNAGACAALYENRVHGGGAGVIVQDRSTQCAIAHNDIHHTGFSAILIEQGANPRVETNRIHEALGAGVSVHGGDTQGKISDNQISNNTKNGVDIRDGATPTVRANVVYANAVGVAVSGSGDDGERPGPLIQDNEIHGNNTGVRLDRGARPVVRNNLVYENEGHGLFVSGSGTKGVVNRNEIRDNELAGVRIEAGADPIVRKNHVHLNATGVVLIGKDSDNLPAAVLKYNDVAENGMGIVVVGGARPTIQHNRIYRQEVNVLVRRSGGLIANNDIFDSLGGADGASNRQSGVNIDWGAAEGQHPVVRENQIHCGEGAGIYIRGDHGDGVQYDTVTNNDIHGNIRTADAMHSNIRTADIVIRHTTDATRAAVRARNSVYAYSAFTGC